MLSLMWSPDLNRSSIFQQQSEERKKLISVSCVISYRYTALHKHTFLLDDERSLHTTHIHMSSLYMYRIRLTFINMSAAWQTQRQHVLAIPASLCLHRAWKEKPFGNDACTKGNSIQPCLMEAYGEKGRTHTRHCSNPGKE